MTLFSPDHLPKDLETTELRRDARLVLGAYEKILAAPAFEHDVDIAVLTKIATDESMPLRERRRAAEVLLRYRVRVLEQLADAAGVREQVLRDLGIDVAAGRSAQLTQVNTKIEIVRSEDWREGPRAAAPPPAELEAGDEP